MPGVSTILTSQKISSRVTNELLKASFSSARSIDTQLETYLVRIGKIIWYRLPKFSIPACVPRGTHAGRFNDLNFSKISSRVTNELLKASSPSVRSIGKQLDL